MTRWDDEEWDRAVARLEEIQRQQAAEKRIKKMLRDAKRQDEIEVKVLKVRDLDG